MRGAICLLVAATATLFSPGAVADCPEWTRGRTPGEYPPNRFLVGMGVVPGIWDAARGEEAGKAAAQSEIAKQLEVKVVAQTEMHEEAISGHSSVLSVHESAKVGTSLVLPGARVALRCLDAKTTTFYLLSVLDRQDAAVRVVAGIVAANKRGTDDLEAAEAALALNDPLAAVPPLGRAASAQLNVQSQSVVLLALVAGEAPAPFASYSKISGLIAKVMSRTRVVFAIDDPDGALVPALTESLSRRNIQIGTTSAQSLVSLVGKIEVVRLGQAAYGGIVVRVRASVAISRMDTGAVIATVVKEESAGAASEADARRKASTAVARAVVPLVEERLIPLLVPPAGADQ